MAYLQLPSVPPSYSCMTEESIPPSISFDPPLYIRRQAVVHRILTALSHTSRFDKGLTRLLDVGCGGCQFIQRLTPCDDYPPLEVMTGLDIDNIIYNKETWESLKPGGFLGEGTADERWRPLKVELLNGSFENIDIKSVGYHDVVVSIEVIEHLDPGPNAQFAAVLLGKLMPKICIVTTPNRDFNALFDYIEKVYSPNKPASRYYRDGVPYGMRHHDHRFEWTREEFRAWAVKSADEHGYDVAFCGAGGLGRGLVLNGAGKVDDILQDAATACSDDENKLAIHSKSSWDILPKLINESNDIDHQSIVRRVFGDCTQIAVFVIKEENQHILDEFQTVNKQCTNDLLPTVFYQEYPFQPDEFPITLQNALKYIMENRLEHLIPDIVSEQWRKNDWEYSRDRKSGYISDLISSTANHDISPESKVRYFSSTTSGQWDVKKLEIIVTAQSLWEDSNSLRRACHYNYGAFCEIIDTAVLKFDGSPDVELNESDEANTEPRPEIFSHLENGSTVMTAKFSANEPHQFPTDDLFDIPGPLSTDKSPSFLPPIDGNNEIESSPTDDDNVEEDLFDSNFFYNYADYDRLKSYDTVIEWVPISQDCGKIRLPKSTIEDGTLYLGSEEGERLIRIIFFGPRRNCTEFEDSNKYSDQDEKWESQSENDSIPDFVTP